MDFTEQRQVAAGQVGNHWYYRAKFALLRKSLGDACAFGRSRRLADVGCGLGVFLTKLEKAELMTGSQMVGIDPEATPGQRAIGGSTLLVKSWPNESFDIILMMDVLEHIEDDRSALLTAWRHLKPGGVIFITVPAFQFLWSNHDHALGHYRRYSLESLRRLLGTVGEKQVIQSHYFYLLIFPLVAVVRWLRRGRDEASSDLKPAPGWINAILARTLALEAGVARYNQIAGVSAVALVRKPTGT